MGDKLSRRVRLATGPGLASHGAQPIRSGLPAGCSSRRALRALLAVIVYDPRGRCAALAGHLSSVTLDPPRVDSQPLMTVPNPKYLEGIAKRGVDRLQAPECPRCAKPMGELVCFDLRLDRCETCGAHWLPAAKLRSLAQKTGREDLPTDSLAFVPDAGPGWKCPRCTVESLFRGKVGTRVLSQCHRCNGVLLPWETLSATDADSSLNAENASEAGVLMLIAEMAAWLFLGLS